MGENKRLWKGSTWPHWTQASLAPVWRVGYPTSTPSPFPSSPLWGFRDAFNFFSPRFHGAGSLEYTPPFRHLENCLQIPLPSSSGVCLSRAVKRLSLHMYFLPVDMCPPGHTGFEDVLNFPYHANYIVQPWRPVPWTNGDPLFDQEGLACSCRLFPYSAGEFFHSCSGLKFWALVSLV